MESDLSYLRDQKKTLLSSPTTISLSSVNIGVNRVIPIVYQGGETWSFVIDDADNFIKNHQKDRVTLTLHGVNVAKDGLITKRDISEKSHPVTTGFRFPVDMLVFVFDENSDAKFVIMDSCEESSNNDTEPVDDDIIESKMYPENSLFLRYIPEKIHWGFAFNQLPKETNKQRYHVSWVTLFGESQNPMKFLRKKSDHNVTNRIRDEVEIYEMIPFMLRSLGFSLTCEASNETKFSASAFEIVKRKRNAARKAALTLVAIRKFKFQEHSLINWCPKEIVKMIAQKIWDRRLEYVWSDCKHSSKKKRCVTKKQKR